MPKSEVPPGKPPRLASRSADLWRKALGAIKNLFSSPSSTPSTSRSPSPNVPRPRTLIGDSIPVEIYLKIITQHLATPDLLTLLRVSRFIHIITAPTLYPRLYTTVDITLLGTTGPLSIHNILNPSRILPTVIFSTVLESSLTRGGIQTDIRRIIFKAPLPNQFEHTIHLTLTQHSHGACTLPTPLHMPQLQTLRIRPSGINDDLNLCSDQPNSPCCPLIANLHPRQLIIGGYSTGLFGNASGLWPKDPPSFPPPFVKHLVVLVGIYGGFEQGSDSGAALLKNLPSTLEKVSIVVSGSQKCRTEWKELWGTPMVFALIPFPNWRSMTMGVMRTLMCDAKEVEIVGSEFATRFWPVTTTRQDGIESYMRNQFMMSMLTLGKGVEESREKAKKVKFLDEEAFELREGWFSAARDESTALLAQKLMRIEREKRAAEACRLAQAQERAKLVVKR